MRLRQIDFILIFQGIYFIASAIYPFIQMKGLGISTGDSLSKIQLYSTSFLALLMGIGLLLLIGYPKIKTLKALSFSSSLVFLFLEFALGGLSSILLIDIILEFVLLTALARNYTNRSVTRL